MKIARIRIIVYKPEWRKNFTLRWITTKIYRFLLLRSISGFWSWFGSSHHQARDTIIARQNDKNSNRRYLIPRANDLLNGFLRSLPVFVIVRLKFSEYFCLHLITACYWVEYQEVMFLYSEFNMNQCETTHYRQQQSWPGTQHVEYFSSLSLWIFFQLVSW